MRQLAMPFEPVPPTTDATWRLAASLERRWLAAGTCDAQRAARFAFDEWVESAGQLFELGLLGAVPREVRRGA